MNDLSSAPVADHTTLSNAAAPTAMIVAAALGKLDLSIDEIGNFTSDIFSRLSGGEGFVEAQPTQHLEPAVPIDKSVTPDAIICLENGRPMKMLKRHLSTEYGMTPDEYRAKWGLPADYPMVAPNYAETRRDLAKKIGLGRKPGQKVGRRKKAAAAPAKKS